MSSFVNDLKSSLSETLHEVEATRIEALKQKGKATRTCLIIMGCAFLFSLLIAALASDAGGGAIVAFLIPLVIGIITCLIVYNCITGDSAKRYEARYKSEIVAKVARHLQPGMTFFPNYGLSKDTFKSTGHYSSSIDRYSSEDLFEGKIGDTSVSFSELHAEDRRTRTDSKGNTSTYYVTIFKGVLFIADFNKHLQTWVTVNPDNETDGFFGWIGKKVQKLGGNLIRLENPTFEKHFVVRSPDPVQARYILTPAMQERLLDLRSKMNGKMKISFQRSSVYITVSKSDDWFEPNINVPVTSDSQILQLAQQMHHFFQIVEVLDLNTRIWTKE